MAELKKVLISFPDNLLKEIDSVVSIEKTNRSEFVRGAMKIYLRERKKLEVRNNLKKGYKDMAAINLRLAEVFFDADNDQQLKYEERLKEMEK